MTIKHTATPWKLHAQGDASEYCLLTNDKGWVIAFRINGEFANAQELANAKFIETACNAHDELLEALQEIVDVTYSDPRLLNLIGKDRFAKARAAIAKATGES